jgi:hypothetical protein
MARRPTSGDETGRYGHPAGPAPLRLNQHRA